MDDVIELLNTAVSTLEEAGDLMSDILCDQWADVGGVGRPPKNSHVGRIYVLAVEVEEVLEAVRDRRP